VKKFLKFKRVKIQKKQISIKKLILSTILFSGIFLVIFNINFSFLQINSGRHVIKVCYSSLGAANQASLNTEVTGNLQGIENGSWMDNFNPFPRLLMWIILALAKMISLMASLIAFSLSDTMMSLFNNEGIYTGWKTVRDMLNIMFIFFLLFSAFSTIFQVSKYHIKSTWVMIVVMALLVNFSWPITRVMIDFSNVTMAYIIGEKHGEDVSKGGTGLMAKLGSSAAFTKMIVGEDYFNENTNKIKNADGVVAAMIIGIIIGAIFLFTIGAIALLLLMRVILLAVLLVFASAGFVFAAFPSTRGTANQWWDALLKQLFLGPVVLFALMLTVGVLDSMNFESKALLGLGAYKNLPNYAVTIILLWSGIIASQKISGQTAGFALGGARRVRGAAWKGTKFGAGVGDKVIAGGVNRMNNSDSKIMKTIGGGMSTIRSMPDRGKNIYNRNKASGEDALAEAKAHGLNDGAWGGDKHAMDNLNKKNQNKIKKEQDNESTGSIAAGLAAAKGDKLIASIETLSKREDLSADEMKDLAKSLRAVKSQFGADSKEVKGAESKIVKKAKETGNGHTIVNEGIKTSREYFGGLDAKELAKENVFKEYGNNPSAANKEMFDVAQRRISKFSPDNKQKMRDAMSLDQSKEYARAKARARGGI